MDSREANHPRIAIACQGGGSHTAFTAGVLDRLLEESEVAFDVVELTGTSGGAICAFAAWFGLASEGRMAGRETSRRLLAEIWSDIAARGPTDATMNAVGVGVARAQGMGAPMPTLSPYDAPVSHLSRTILRNTLEDAVDPDELAAVVGRDEPTPPRLEIGAVDVKRGTFASFTERDVSHDAVLASAAVPPLFRAAPVTRANGVTRWYWDGLFSQNPPLGELFGETDGRLDRPEEIWIVRINPQRTDELPRRIEEIGNRRNELGGNLSVNQELRHVRLLNAWSAAGELGSVYRPLEVKTIDLLESAVSPTGSLDYATKLDRSPSFLERLWEHGREQADRFLAVERDRRRVSETVDATWTRGRDAADAQFSAEFEARVPTGLLELRRSLRGESEREVEPLDRAAYVEAVRSLREAISGLQLELEEVLAQPGKVATRWCATGTHTGTLVGIEATGRGVSISGMRIDHLEEGRLTGSWTLFEGWSLLRQLEITDPPSPLSTVRRVTATPVVTQLCAPAENEALARVAVEEGWNRGRRESLERVFADDCVLYLDDETNARGWDAYWGFVSRYREAFPDLELTVEDTVSEGDKIVLRLSVRGTHEGTFLGVEPTGRRIDVDRMVIHHVDDGRIVETGLVEDTVRLLHQLGEPLSAFDS